MLKIKNEVKIEQLLFKIFKTTFIQIFFSYIINYGSCKINLLNLPQIRAFIKFDCYNM